MNARLTPEQAWQKIKHYCAYQERSHYETKQKLYGFGLFKNDVEILLSRLIEENYLNEERYAAAYAGGKFRMNKWGRIKIVYGLKQKQVSAYNIKAALRAIGDADYNETLQKLVATKWQQLKGEQYINRQVKTSNYLLQKGFESPLIQQAIKALREGEKE